MIELSQSGFLCQVKFLYKNVTEICSNYCIFKKKILKVGTVLINSLLLFHITTYPERKIFMMYLKSDICR